MKPAIALLGLALAVPAAGQDEELETRVDAAIERGVAHLLELQNADGTWGTQSWRGSSPGANALILYTLLKCGLPPDHEVVRRAIARMNIETIDRTYQAACMLLALSAHGAREHRLWISELTDLLLEWQHGDWGYPGGRDLSNTQYAALGLRAAALSGVEIPAERWRELAKGVRRYGRGKGYGYDSGGVATGSMTCAGVGTLAICDAMLTKGGEITRTEVQKFAKDRDRGLSG